MVFSSLIFIYIFLPITLLIYYITPKRFRNLVVFIASILFYAWGEPYYIALLLISVIVDYFGAIIVEKTRADKDKSRFIFVTVLVINISVLFFFKYYGFLINNINALCGTSLRVKALPLPLGISFYTFKLVSYMADVYLNKVEAERNFINFGTYVSMFYQLTAGPIGRFTDLKNQIINRNETIEKFAYGIQRFLFGLGKKVILANNLSLIWNNVKSMQYGSISVISSWIGIISFTLQIYFDFSGYSDMAIGLGQMMGFEFKENFDFPYISRSITEFWRRWHISLGSWFKDYIYIPLGGNRRGKSRQIFNLCVVWFATGLWHGSNWTFVFWGLYYGVIIIIEKLFLLKYLKKIPKIFGIIYSMIIVTVGWVFFDSESINKAFSYIGIMFGAGNNLMIDNMAKYLISSNLLILFISIICATPLVKRIIMYITEKKKTPGIIVSVVISMAIFVISTAFLVYESYSPFLYFKF
ncbi:MAG: MBOAT family O-acyltransferase [Inconstantimicrobium porci]|uniref:MBOAT family O-acyltransferase n=1 Tax=Inconstantimicrobium porci TaxID=2652291 RepID=UPI00240976F6|nr:MBOAT family O-acyltransferase [Inconstantimicrobium porci]MDD6771169.1 MBOAT family protein [Inconstantimicrobium porci]MDY5911097.1 MBOAT family O-acyltransferase [Inconstantimicrobium porci]